MAASSGQEGWHPKKSKSKKSQKGYAGSNGPLSKDEGRVSTLADTFAQASIGPSNQQQQQQPVAEDAGPEALLVGTEVKKNNNGNNSNSTIRFEHADRKFKKKGKGKTAREGGKGNPRKK